MTSDADPGKGRLSRRSLFTAAGAGGLGLAAGAVGAFALGKDRAEAAGDVVPFHGAHQAGITTDAQDRMHTAAFDLTASTRQSVISLLRDWTEAAESLTAGRDIGETGASGGAYDAPPEDTGEAQDLHAAHLTITFGFGRTLFVKDGVDRYGVAAHLPEALIDLPLFSGDALEEGRSGGDLIVQACADDPQVAVHAVRNLARIAFGRARVRWSQIGFGRTASTSAEQKTPRNLFGFKDGTSNLKVQEDDLLAEHLWVSGGPAAESWLNGGTYMVVRRIRMHIETWDRTTLREQELVVGRTKREGAPLSGGTEFTAPDFSMPGRDGPLIDPASHLALAHPDHNGGARMLRRGYNYTDGSDGLGRLDAGQFFIAYFVDPRTHYVPMQSAMAKNDLMVEYLRHTGSGLFAVPPGITPGGYIGQGLFEA
ncbi:iron uptake transporter deferrochelatase/peroxidase subunit [Arthrobacter jinronghuae]|uniref:Deferrochelatase n=1 Tax=Arthrobacter jinronghuae TaxID=2964609 RepID=A0ABT1NV07_9MICC|nr:iron uptake transporter deferrochelatase/peroxidase subunit [Arthrobacter jinronghuae]MCQ1951560.1 iron uptake transporter deferrochelatase/peroxidase subunit [Arthrobacter jinronghuae]MCQ1954739.1 iron uptake transporter deferrochelatase/peroxidase subunit [Arthrobacter sp. zg-Y238]UWX79635.1 iron uptake transporter deferrochelatase/peroxidase subunit [Arthrobacter jinronghuae]